MTEKKMQAELKLKQAQKEITEKDAKIKELEELVKKLSGGTIGTDPNSSHELRQSHDKSAISDLNARVDFTATEKRLQAQVLGTQAPTFSRMNPGLGEETGGYGASNRRQQQQQRHNYSNEGEDDFWYQTGDDDMLK